MPSLLASLRDGDVLRFGDELLQNNAIWAARDERGACVLHWCAWHGLVDIAAAWLASFPDLADVVDAQQQTPLMWAVRRGDSAGCLAVANLLVDAGANVNAHDAKGLTPFLLAAQGNNRRAAAALLLRGARAATGDGRGTLPAHWAAYNGSLDMLHLLRADGPLDLSVRDAAGITPLGRAIQQGHGDCVRFILDYPRNRHGVDPLAPVDGTHAAAELAATLKQEGHAAAIKKSMTPPAWYSSDADPRITPSFYAFGGVLAVAMYALVIRESVVYGGFIYFLSQTFIYPSYAKRTAPSTRTLTCLDGARCRWRLCSCTAS
jgi:ankyrin repeat protein